MQAQLASGDVAGARSSLEAALRAEPRDGFNHHLLAQIQVFGLNLGPEAVAIYRHLEASNPANAAFTARAELELHRQDKFLGPSSEWLVNLQGRLQGLVDSLPLPERYELLLSQRSLHSLVKQRQAARDRGLMAHAIEPKGLQGRIAALQVAVHGKRTADAEAICLDILRTDPWTAEACSMLWALRFPDEAGRRAEAEQAQDRVRQAIAQLQEAWIGDPITSGELLKFFERVKDSQGAASWKARIEQAHPGWEAPPSHSWWKPARVVAVPYRAMNVTTSKAQGLPDATQRMARLMERWGDVPPEGDQDWGLDRYLDAVASTARELGDIGRERQALDAKLQGRPEDADALLARALVSEAEEAPAFFAASCEALRARRYEPLGWASRRTFDDWVDQQRQAWAQRRQAAEQLGLEPPPDPFPPDDGFAWLRFADSLARTDPSLALQADLQGLSLLTAAEADNLPGRWIKRRLRRFEAAFPQVAALAGDLRGALLAAASGRRELRRARLRGASPDAHPFVGQPAPALELVDIDGEALSLPALRGRVLVVDFWATWCGPCRKEMPELQAALERLAGEPVTFLMLSVDESADVVAPFREEHGYDFRFAHIGPEGVKQRWQVRGIPSLFLVGPDGQVAEHHQGFREGVGSTLEAEIRALLPGDPSR